MIHARWDRAHVIVVQGAATPSEAEWQAYLDDLETWLPDVVGTLIVTDGGGPSSSQRRALKALFHRVGRKSVRAAVVSSSLMARGIVNALNLFNPGIRVFHPDAMTDALVYIGAALDGPAVLAEVEWLRQRLARDA